MKNTNPIAPLHGTLPGIAMTNTTDAAIEALTLHQLAIDPIHRAAWRRPVVDIYAPGAQVWLWDHYNTAVIADPGSKAGTWLVDTTDADGTVSRFCYPTGQLRPALEAKVFTWS